MSVKVAVRVRPFNPREIELGCQCCVEMNDKTTTLIDFDNDSRRRDFTFDYSFWSHDGFATNEAGLMIPENDKYADQQIVFENLGQEVLKNAWDGYHCCLFAYGQTGAGKSYSMLGYGANKGIVPITTEEIFNRISQNDDPKKSYEVLFSMLEIYNERIQDLLIPVNERPQAGLKVRENKTLGVYVEGLSKWPVNSYQEIEAKMELGNRHRSVASTMMNSTSSRAHTIITIEFKQITQAEKRKAERLSVINLVDLAGSEKVGKTLATGERLKEGCSINLSLTVLGVVISKLADISTGKGKNVVVPYRDSALTRILQNALGGNSKTLMICAISPATDNYEETLSTLRYADQAKKIKNNAVVNESETDKMIRELKQENEKLKNFLEGFVKTGGQLPPNVLQQFGIHIPTSSNSENVEPTSKEDTPESLTRQLQRRRSSLRNTSAEEEYKRKVEELENQLKSNQALVNEYQKSFEDKVKEAKKNTTEPEIKQNYDVPHLINLNEDPLLNGKIYFNLVERPLLRVGKKDGEPKPDIILSSIGIQSNHAIISYENENIYLEPVKKDCGEYIFLNGNKVFEKCELHHLDRLMFGSTTALILKYPDRKEKQRDKNINEIDLDWEFVKKEAESKEDKNKNLEQFEAEEKRQQKIKQIEQEFVKHKEQVEKELKEEFRQKLQLIQKENRESIKKEMEQNLLETLQKFETEKIQKELEIEQKKKEILEEVKITKLKENRKKKLENKIAKLLPQITEANLMALELKRSCTFSLKTSYIYSDFIENEQNIKNQKTKVQVQVVNQDYNCTFLLSIKTFIDRYNTIKELLDVFFETSIIPITPVTSDPFWDPPSPRLLGQGVVKLLPICYLMDNPCEVTLISEHGKIGFLSFNMLPCKENGELLREDEIEFIEDPRTIIGKNLSFILVIEKATLLPDACLDTYVEYSMLGQKDKFEICRTKIVKGVNVQPSYSYMKKHSFININEKTYNYLYNNSLLIKVYGYDNNTSLEVPKEPMPKLNKEPVAPKNLEPVVTSFLSNPLEKNKKVEPPKENVAQNNDKKKDGPCEIF